MTYQEVRSPIRGRLRPFLKDGVSFLQLQMESYNSMFFLRLAFHGDKIFAKTLFSMLKGKF